MARYHGKVGYVKTEETAPGVWEEIEEERTYYGDILSQSRRTSRGESLNDDISTSTRVSLVADAYAFQNFMYMRYIWWSGVKWKVQTVEPTRPRLTLYLGEVYNG